MSPASDADARSCGPARKPVRAAGLRRGLRAAAWAGLLLAVAMVAEVAVAEDRVVLQPESGTSRIILPCEIVDYTGEKITLKINNGTAVREYPSEQVVEIRTPRNKADEQARELFRERKWAEAEQAFETALRQEPREWMRRELVAMLIRCGLRRGDYSRAGARFLILLRSDPQTRHYALIPLSWDRIDVNTELRDAARVWITASEPAARLMGASFLLQDEGYRQVAENDLRELAANTDERIRQLAALQLLRLRLIRDEVTLLELGRWESRIQDTRPELRGGGWYLLGRALQRRREFGPAAAAFLWVPLVYEENGPLAAQAALHAADALARIGQLREAEVLYRETAERYSGTFYAEEAARRLRTAAERRDAAGLE